MISPRRAILLLALAGAACCPASTVTGPLEGLTSITIPPDGDAVILRPIAYLSSTTASAGSALENDFDGWTFFYSEGGLFGNLTISLYTAYSPGPHDGGGGIRLTYTADPRDVVSFDSLQFVQVVSTNDPLGGTTSPYVDPRPGDDNGGPPAPQLPFYFTLDEIAEQKDPLARTFSFSDFPARPCRDHPDCINWSADLYLASWDGALDGLGNGTVHMYDGIRWGWDLYCVPEPGTFALLSAALIAVALLSRMPRRRA
jgi:hypothetical protein